MLDILGTNTIYNINMQQAGVEEAEFQIRGGIVDNSKIIFLVSQ